MKINHFSSEYFLNIYGKKTSILLINLFKHLIHGYLTSFPNKIPKRKKNFKIQLDINRCDPIIISNKKNSFDFILNIRSACRCMHLHNLNMGH